MSQRRPVLVPWIIARTGGLGFGLCQVVLDIRADAFGRCRGEAAAAGDRGPTARGSLTASASPRAGASLDQGEPRLRGRLGIREHMRRLEDVRSEEVGLLEQDAMDTLALSRALRRTWTLGGDRSRGGMGMRAGRARKVSCHGGRPESAARGISEAV